MQFSKTVEIGKMIIKTGRICIWVLSFCILNTAVAEDLSFKYEFNIARKELNRIAFPFSRLTVNTVSNAQMKMDKGVIYVVPDSAEDITLFVSPYDDPDVSFLILLHPNADSANNIIISMPDSVQKKHLKIEQEKTVREHKVRQAKGIHAAVSYESRMMDNLKTVWLRFNAGENVLLPDGIPLSPIELAGIKEERLCGSRTPVTVMAGVRYQNYMYLAGSATNALGVAADIECMGKDVLAWSILNSALTAPFAGRIMVLVLPLSQEL